MTLRVSPTFPAYAGTFRNDRAGNARAGSCTLCRTSKVSAERPCVELGKNAQPFREGMVVLCFNCATSVGEAIGMLPAAREAELRADLDALRAERDRLLVEIEAFSSMRDALSALSGVAGGH